MYWTSWTAESMRMISAIVELWDGQKKTDRAICINQTVDCRQARKNVWFNAQPCKRQLANLSELKIESTTRTVNTIYRHITWTRKTNLYNLNMEILYSITVFFYFFYVLFLLVYIENCKAFHMQLQDDAAIRSLISNRFFSLLFSLICSVFQRTKLLRRDTHMRYGYNQYWL
jgi:hypothetical protein